MSSLWNEGIEGPGVPETTPKYRVYENPYRISGKLFSRNWEEPIIRATFVVTRLHEVGTTFSWRTLRTDSAAMSRRAYFHIIQGLPIKDLFDTDSWLERNDGGIAVGPFLFLGGTPNDAQSTTPRISNLVLGQVVSIPDGVSSEQVLSIMLGQVLGT